MINRWRLKRENVIYLQIYLSHTFEIPKQIIITRKKERKLQRFQMKCLYFCVNRKIQDNHKTKNISRQNLIKRKIAKKKIYAVFVLMIRKEKERIQE